MHSGNIYPPEEIFREECVKSVEEAEKRVKEGKAKSFNLYSAFIYLPSPKCHHSASLCRLTLSLKPKEMAIPIKTTLTE